MIALFFAVFLLLGIALWLWLVVRIWSASSIAMRISFILIIPAYWWGYALRDDTKRNTNVLPLVLANIAVALLVAITGYKSFQLAGDTMNERIRQAAKSSNDMTRWCKEKNDASYDAELGTCVETGKTEALARSQSSDIFGQLTAYLETQNIKGEFDQSQAAAAVQPQLATAEIAAVTAYYLFPLSMSQPSIAVLLCVSASACIKYQDDAKERDIGNVIRNDTLLLIAAPKADDDPRIRALTAAFSKFKAL